MIHYRGFWIVSVDRQWFTCGGYYNDLRMAKNHVDIKADRINRTTEKIISGICKKKKLKQVV
jgi:hypothetical protein